MRGFVALLRKEWRDIRATTWVFAGFVLLGCIAVRWSLAAFSVKNADPSWQRYFEPFVPACVLLFAAMAGADTVGGETASRRIDQLVLLPVRPLTVWMAKAVTVFGAVFVFFAWTALVQIGVLWAIDGRAHVERFFEFADRARWVPLVVATFAAITLLVSTLRLRGIGAVIASGALAAALWAGTAKYVSLVGFDTATFATFTGRTFAQRFGGDLAVVAVGFAAIFLVASALAFAKGRVYLSIVRPALLAAGVLAGTVVAPAAVYAASALRVDPEDPRTQVQWVDPSPYGRHVALWMTRQVGSGNSSRAYVLDTGTGSLRELPRSDIRMDPFQQRATWDADGSVIVQDFSSSRLLRDWVDPVTLRVRRSQSISLRELADEGRAASDEYRRTHAWYCSGSAKRPDTAPASDPPLVGRIQRNYGNHELLTVPTWIPPVMTYGSDRVVFAPEPAALAMKVLPDGAPRVFLRAQSPIDRTDLGSPSPDGTMVLVRLGGAWKAVTIETGTVTEVPIARGTDRPVWWTVQGDAARKLVVVSRKDELSQVFDVSSGARGSFEAVFSSAFATTDGHLLLWRGKRIDLYDRELRHVRTVWSIPAEGSAK